MAGPEPVVVSASQANRSFSALLRQVAEGQSASGAPRSWHREELYD